METALSGTYRLTNVDCANCAAKIENSLRKLPTVDFVSYDYAQQTLHIQGLGFGEAEKHIHRIEPEARLALKDGHDSSFGEGEESDPYSLKKEGILLTIASLLFLVVLFCGSQLAALHPPYPEWMIIMAAYFLSGWNVILNSARTIRNGSFFDENVLMLIATVGAMAIQAYSEAVGVMIFYRVGEMLQSSAVSRSRRSIRSLLSAKPDRARVKTLMGLEEMSPEAVPVGEHILIKPGDKIPLDGDVIEGTCQLDTSALTGEAVPIAAGPGDAVMAGQICITGALTVKVTRPFRESSIAKVMELVENATARKANTEKFITVFARHYTPAVVVIAACIALLPTLTTGASFETWLYRALVLLVISCPCALVISIPLGYFGGIGRASRNGILVKGSNYIDALSGVKTVVFDKTGTLTEASFKVKDIVNSNGFTKSEMLEFAAAAECQSNHPIAASILTAYASSGREIDPSAVSDHTEYSGMGVTTTYRGRSILVGNDLFLHHRDIPHGVCGFSDTVVHIVVDGKYAGHITIGDRIKPDARQAIQSLRALGVRHIAMLTGDNSCVADAVGNRIGLDDVYAELMPEDKVDMLEELSRAGDGAGKVAFVGDGINDAPVIARADVGIAMGGLGSDAAVETADVVLMTDSPLKVAEAIEVAKDTRVIVWQNIMLAFFIKGVFMLFGAMGMASMWEAVFADMGTALIAVANSTRIFGKDKMRPIRQHLRRIGAWT